MIHDKVFLLRRILEERGIEAGAAFIDPTTKDPLSTLKITLHAWLAKRQFHNAAIVLWGPNKFTPEPLLVRETWQVLDEANKIIVIGGAGLGKSYNGAVWYLLDWIMDADNTFIQCLSVTKQHAKTNIFAHIKDLHQSSIIPLPGERKGESIQAPSGSDHAGILLKALPQGDNGYGKLRGFHPYPRKIPHPVYGKLTRIRLLLDEAEEIPIGIWEGVQNMLSTQDPDDYKGQIKIFAATNPKDKLSELGKRVEPATGWQSIDPDKHHRWISGTNWTIQRLDALRSENYIQKKQIFPGFQSYMGVQEYASLGTNTVDWWAMVRGFFPPQGIFGVVVPPYLIEQNMGQWVFTKNVMNAGGLDVAFANHGDGLVFSHFRFGEANAYIDQSGQLVPLVRPQLAIQFDDIFPLQKLKTKALAEYIKELCETFKIQPQWFALDCTGNATGLYHTLTDIWSDEVIGVDYSSKATDLKVLREDKKAANEQYDGIVTELFFAVQRLSEAGVIKYNPNCSDTNYIKELTSRKFKQKAAGFVRVQSKHDYMADGRDSPDYADSFTLGIHAVRRASENFVPSLVGPEDKPPAPPPPAPDWTDTIEYETFD